MLPQFTGPCKDVGTRPQRARAAPSRPVPGCVIFHTDRSPRGNDPLSDFSPVAATPGEWGVAEVHCVAVLRRAALTAGVGSPFPDGEAEALEAGGRRAELWRWPGLGGEGASAARPAGAELRGAGPSASAPAPMGGRPPCASPQVRGGGGGGGVQSPEPQPSRSQAGGGTMACAGLLTVCLIRPPAPEPPRPPAPAPAPAAGPAGHALFQDVSGERAGGAGAVALGLVILPRGRSRSLWTASVSLPSLILVFRSPRPCVSLQVCWGLCLGLWVSHDFSLAVSVCFPYLYLAAFVSRLLPLTLSLLISPCSV